MFLNDLVTILEGAGIGTYGTSIFISSRASIPILASGLASVHMIETGGTAPVETHNDLVSPAYVQPSAQVTCRARDFEVAMAKAIAVRDALYGIRNELIGSTWYLWVKPLQEPFDGGIGDDGQVRVQFNVTSRKRPS